MMLEFYRHGGRSPQDFDIFMHSDGEMSFDHRRPTKGYVRVIVEIQNAKPSAYQTTAIFNLIKKHKICTVAFYDFDG